VQSLYVSFGFSHFSVNITILKSSQISILIVTLLHSLCLQLDDVLGIVTEINAEAKRHCHPYTRILQLTVTSSSVESVSSTPAGKYFFIHLSMI
jgi:hypothetical protein